VRFGGDGGHDGSEGGNGGDELEHFEKCLVVESLGMLFVSLEICLWSECEVYVAVG
jgi:hypothetical protein